MFTHDTVTPALISAQFTGSYSYSGFRSCIAVNPYDTRGTANAIHQVRALTSMWTREAYPDLGTDDG